jgi:hypothetical protein
MLFFVNLFVYWDRLPFFKQNFDIYCTGTVNTLKIPPLLFSEAMLIGLHFLKMFIKSILFFVNLFVYWDRLSFFKQNFDVYCTGMVNTRKIPALL